MKNGTFLTILLTLFCYQVPLLATAKWSFLTYIQADNNLAPFATYNFKDMQKVGSTDDVNILVQWDKVDTKATHRYKILQNNFVVNASINQEMGINPATEIVSSMQWVKNTYPAEKYGLVLWNHGNGVLDRSGKINRLIRSWLMAPGLREEYFTNRGILYDYSQDTFLDNQGLSSACNKIKKTIGQKIDFLGMDACLMAMIEVAYQVKNSVKYLVGSQQTEPGYGWAYAELLSSLISIPTMNGAELGETTVQSYSNFYSTGSNADPTHTQSTIDVSKINAAKTTLELLLASIRQMESLDKTSTKNAIKKARNNTLEFYIPDYIDLIDFYNKLSTEFSTLVDNRKRKSTLPRQKNLIRATTAAISAIDAAKIAAQNTILSSLVGSELTNKAHGLSIYFPADGKVDSSYKKTTFAKQTTWTSMIEGLR